MHFDLVDQVLELTDDRIVTIKNVTAGEEYLQDHFPTFPVLPGVLMIEAVVQAARRLLEHKMPEADRFVLGEVRALKYGSFVRPGDALRVEVEYVRSHEDGSHTFKGSGRAIRSGESASADGPTSISGRLTLRPVHPADGWRNIAELG